MTKRERFVVTRQVLPALLVVTEVIWAFCFVNEVSWGKKDFFR